MVEFNPLKIKRVCFV